MMKRLIFGLILFWPSFIYAQATNYCVNQSYNTFEGGTPGAQPTIASLNASQHGFNTGTWTQNGGTVMTYSNVDMPALVAPGRLCADSTTYTNSPGTGSIVFTGDGHLDFNEIVYNLAGTVPRDVWATMEYNEDYGAGDGSKIDAFGIHGTNDFILINAYGVTGGSRFLQAECTSAGCSTSPNVNWTPSTQCPCKFILHYQAGNGTAGTHQAIVLDKNGVLIANFSYPSPAIQDLANRVYFGDAQNQTNVTPGKHSWFDNEQISLDGSIPGQFCKGATPTWTSSPDSSTLQGCINGITSGDTVNVLSGTATWLTEVNNFTSKLPVSIIGQTLISGGGTSNPSANDTTPGTSTVINFNNPGNTTLGLGVATTGCPAYPTPCLRLSGFTFQDGHVGANGSVQIFGALPWPPTTFYRVDNIHFIALASSGTGEMIHVQDGWGVTDHYYVQNHSSATIVEQANYGDAGNHGFGSWNTALSLGTNKASYVETSSFLDDFCNTSGPGDGYAGARAVYRHDYGLNNHVGFHGTDSNNSLSVFSIEEYDNTWVNNVCSGLTNMTSRGGTYIWWGDSYSGSATWSGGKLQELRADPSTAAGNDWATWGGANGIPWYLNSATLGNAGTLQATTSGPDWTASHSYTCSQAAPCVIIPTSNNSGNYNYVSFSSCTSGSSRPNPFNQNAGTSTPDGSGGTACGWINQWGTTSTGANAQWCALNQDIPVTALSQCPAGDQSGPLRFLDGPSSTFGYPGRNQVGRSNQGVGTGETLNPDYQWLNTGSNASYFVQNDPTGNFVQANRDYYNYQTSLCSPTQTTGVCSGLFSAKASTCTKNVGFWATDQNTLYQCGATSNWIPYYTPFTYPHPLIQSSSSVTASPNPTTFGTVAIGTSQQITVVVSNNSGSTITFTSVTITLGSGTPSGDFSETTTCTGNLSNGATCNVVVTFRPTAAIGTNESGTLNVAYTGFSGSPLVVPLTGTSGAAGIVSVSPTSESFGSIVVGTGQSASQTATVTNNSGATITFPSGNITYSSTGTATGTNFLTTPTATPCAGTLANGGTCTVATAFLPVTAGTFMDTLNIAFTGASGSPLQVSLSGTGLPSGTPGQVVPQTMIAQLRGASR